MRFVFYNVIDDEIFVADDVFMVSYRLVTMFHASKSIALLGEL